MSITYKLMINSSKLRFTIFLFILVSSGIPPTVGNAYLENSMSMNAPIGLLGNSENYEISQGISTFLENVNSRVTVLNMDNYLDFEGQLVIFGHGTIDGIKLIDTTYNWNYFASILDNSKSNKIILGSCFGSLIEDHMSSSDKQIISWDGYVDANLIGLGAALEVSDWTNGNNVKNLISKIFRRSYDIIVNKAPVFTLAASESGYTDAYRRQTTGSTWTGTKAKTLWINMDNEYGAYYLSLDVLSSGDVAIDKAMARLVYMAALSSTVAAIIVAAMVAQVLLAELSQYNRREHDYMVGVKGYKYTTMLFFIYHMGDDRYRLNGAVPISIAPLVGRTVYNGIGHISNSWSDLGLDAPSGGWAPPTPGPTYPCHPFGPC